MVGQGKPMLPSFRSILVSHTFRERSTAADNLAKEVRDLVGGELVLIHTDENGSSSRRELTIT
uniref:Uncharacterized protein n=1 Tax=Picea sitchensis TaxID=3332 RepID=A9P1Z9_PICSI|nr:unknown [Picea sitchensis]